MRINYGQCCRRKCAVVVFVCCCCFLFSATGVSFSPSKFKTRRHQLWSGKACRFSWWAGNSWNCLYCSVCSHFLLWVIFSFCEQFEKCDKLWHEYRDRDVVYLIKLKDSFLTNLISLGSSSTHEILQKLHKILILGRNKVTQKVTKLLNFHKL